MREQLGKLRTRVDAARGRGQRSLVLDVEEAAFLLGLARILHEEVFSKPATSDVEGPGPAPREPARDGRDVPRIGGVAVGGDHELVAGDETVALDPWGGR